MSNNQLRGLYQPIWTQAAKYMWYGAIIGCAVKSINTMVIFFGVHARLGQLWLAIMGLLLIGPFVPQKLKQFFYPFCLLMAAQVFQDRSFLFFKALNITFGAIFGVIVVGCLFGIPTGLIVGTLVGYFRRKINSIAPDAEPEGNRPYIKGLLLPISFLIIAIPLYIWFNMNLEKWFN